MGSEPVGDMFKFEQSLDIERQNVLLLDASTSSLAGNNPALAQNVPDSWWLPVFAFLNLSIL
jgi:hypothetical protein